MLAERWCPSDDFCNRRGGTESQVHGHKLKGALPTLSPCSPQRIKWLSWTMFKFAFSICYPRSASSSERNYEIQSSKKAATILCHLGTQKHPLLIVWRQLLLKLLQHAWPANGEDGRAASSMAPPPVLHQPRGGRLMPLDLAVMIWVGGDMSLAEEMHFLDTKLPPLPSCFCEHHSPWTYEYFSITGFHENASDQIT